MSLKEEILSADSLERVADIVAATSKGSLRKSVEPLASEVLRLLRVDVKQALDVAERTCVVAEAVGEPDFHARASWVRAHALAGLLRTREACECYATAAKAYRRLGETLLEARVGIGWVNALMYLSEYKRALEIGQRARTALLEQRDLPAAARLDLNLGNIYHRIEQPLRALEQYDRALKVARAIDDAPMIRIIQFNRANVLTSLGEVEKAEELYQQVSAEAKRSGETRTAGLADYSLGYLLLSRGEYGRAYEALESTRTIFEELADPHYLTIALMDLAELFVEMNAFKRAQAIGRKARTLAERHSMRFEAGRSSLFQAIACLGLGELAQATAHLEDASSAFRAEGNRVSSSLCTIYLAELESRQGRREEASRLLREAARVFAEERLPFRETTTLARLASVELDRKALRASAEAIARARSLMLHRHSPWQRAQIDHVAGRLANAQGRAREGLRLLRRAVEGVEGLRGRIGIEEFRISFSADKDPIYADLVETLLARGKPRDLAEAFATVERSRSRSLVDLLAGQLTRARSAVPPRVARLLERLERLRSELNWLSGFGAGSKGDRRDETRLRRSAPVLRRCEGEIADTMARLQSQDARWGALTGGETVTVEAVQQSLAPGTALVEYYWGGRNGLAFVITRSRMRAMRLSPERSTLRTLVSRLRFQMEKWGYGTEYVRERGTALGSSLDHELAELGGLLWDPLEIDQERVIIVPHGALHAVPFHALPTGNGQRLADRHTISYMPSASAWRHLASSPSPKERHVADARLLAVGVGDSSIPQVDREIDRVRKIFRRGRVLRGKRATRERFLRAAPEAEIIHIASHALFREDDAHFSALKLADGWMSLYDFYGLELLAELVCVSACQSGRSWVGAGDEIVGLARGFLHSGASNLVVSLWPVQDDSTALFMERFYRHLRSGTPAASALRAAQLELREDYPHPYHWAAFILIGKGDPIGTSPRPARPSLPLRGREEL
jgi:CHAT domain-containing protein/tetratricopeptide (TPR) repeat protein